MTIREEFEAVLATAEANWRSANDDLHKAQADRAKANADWDKVVTVQRKADSDRRKAGAVWEQAFPDRRKADAGLVALSKAVADRHKAYVAMNKAATDWVNAEAKLNTATADRNEAIAALDQLNLSESNAWSRERVNTLIKQFGEASKRGVTASTPSTQLSEHAVHYENKRSQNQSSRRKPIHRFNIGFSAQALSPRHALARSPLLRQTIALLSLTLAYLQYYYFDVQLQILSLPSVFG